MKKAGGGKPTGAIAAAIDRDFGSYDNFRKEFINAGIRLRLGLAGGRGR